MKTTFQVLLGMLGQALDSEFDLIERTLSVLNPARSVTFLLVGGFMTQGPGNSFTVPDTIPSSPFSVVAQPLDAQGQPSVVTGPVYDFSGTDTSIIQNPVSADGITVTFSLPAKPKVGATIVKWAGTNAVGQVITGSFTFAVTTGAAVSVVFTMTAPDLPTTAPSA